MKLQNLWDIVINQKLSEYDVDKFSIEEIKTLDHLFENYFAQCGCTALGDKIFCNNYLLILEKIKKLKY